MEFVAYLEFYQPSIFLMENVMGILSMKLEDQTTKSIDVIMEHLTKYYHCRIHRLYASDFEVPQNRRRVIIVGIHKKYNQTPPEIVPIILKKEHRIPVSSILEPKESIDISHFLSEKALEGIRKKKERMIQEGKGFGAQILDWSKPSFTIPARYWKDGYDALVRYNDQEIRKLTLLELKRIQTFPDDYEFEGNMKDQIIQIGNAVPCRFAYHLGKYIQHTFSQLEENGS
jgi:DNA (cytosine-5)-methyltransferase 1